MFVSALNVNVVTPNCSKANFDADYQANISRWLFCDDAGDLADAVVCLLERLERV